MTNYGTCSGSSTSAGSMVSLSVEYLSTPSRFNPGGGAGDQGTDTDSSTSPGNDTSGGSPNLLHALSGEDAVESPPLKHKTSRSNPHQSVTFNHHTAGTTTPPGGSLGVREDEDDDGGKPPQSYIALISMAILQHPQKKMLLGDIYQFIMDRFAHYRNSTDKAWRNSIRHNLSINECFIKAGRADNGKGNYWAIHPACEEDFGKGDFRRRQARRRARRSATVNVSKMPLTYRYSLGYVPMKSTPASGGSSGTNPSGGGAARSSGGYHVSRAHPYHAAGHHQAPHHQHVNNNNNNQQQRHQLTGYGTTGNTARSALENSPPGYNSTTGTSGYPYYHNYQTTTAHNNQLAAYTSSQYYNALTNACLSLNAHQLPVSTSPTSAAASRLGSTTAGVQGYNNTNNDNASTGSSLGLLNTSPTMLSPVPSYNPIQPVSPVSPPEVSSSPSGALLELGSSPSVISSSGSSPLNGQTAITTSSSSSSPLLQGRNSHVNSTSINNSSNSGNSNTNSQLSSSLTITSHFSTSSCVYQSHQLNQLQQGISPPPPPSGFGASTSSGALPGGAAGALYGAGGYPGTSGTSGVGGMYFSDMPALRDAITGLSSISS